MAKLTALFILITLRFIYDPSKANSRVAFLAPSNTVSNPPARLMNFTGSVNNNKVFLQWLVADNGQADQFEIEKSADGKNFALAALVFATEKVTLDTYWFYEKAAKKNFYYRIKLINKNHETSYSSVINIGPKP